MRALAVVAGAVLVMAMVSDAISTLVVTQGRSALWRPTRLWYFGTWRAARAFAIRAPAKAADVALDVYPAASLLGLLVLWLAGLLFGWAIIYWGIPGLRVVHAFGLGIAYRFLPECPIRAHAVS